MKFRGRKKYTKEEAETLLGSTYQLYITTQECLCYYNSPRYGSKSDKLIEALCGKNQEEIIKENEEKLDYLEQKIDYLKQFTDKHGCYNYMG